MRIILQLVILFLLAGCGNYIDNFEGKANKQTSTGDNEQEKNVDDKGINFLLIGVDSRGEENSNSDTIIIANYNKTKGTIKLASIMRDSYVEIPQYKYSHNKINHAYLLGGVDLLKETVKRNFNIDVDNFAIIDFQGFINVVNLIAPDGIDVEITNAMINNMKFDFEPGINKLNGGDLLKYVRFRNDKYSDFGRVKRQQEVLVALKDEAKNQVLKLDGFSTLTKIFTEVSNYIVTDLGWEDVTSLAATLVLNPVNEVKTLRIPVENSFKNSSIKHAGSVLQLDFPKNIEALENFFDE